jgi:hypothetical protein
MSIPNLIDASRRATPEEIEKHYARINPEQTRWAHLEFRRREINRLIAAVTNDLEKFPSRHSEDSFTLHTGILRTLAVYEREITRLKDDNPSTVEWVAILVDALNQAIEQRHSLTILIPALAGMDASKRTSDPDETVYKVLSVAIEQFKETAHAFLDEPERPPVFIMLPNDWKDDDTEQSL